MNTKISETNIEIEKIIPQKVIKNVYERSFIENQIVQIEKQIEMNNEALQECRDILKEMDKLGVTSKSIEIPK